jgi:mannitol/fructose-specific phosphotransferase system IIA component (Ntr-type)
MTTIALLVEKNTTIIIPNVIIPHARKTSITQHTKITTTIIIAIAILSHVGKITFTIVP